MLLEIGREFDFIQTYVEFNAPLNSKSVCAYNIIRHMTLKITYVQSCICTYTAYT